MRVLSNFFVLCALTDFPSPLHESYSASRGIANFESAPFHFLLWRLNMDSWDELKKKGSSVPFLVQNTTQPFSMNGSFCLKLMKTLKTRYLSNTSILHKNAYYFQSKWNETIHFQLAYTHTKTGIQQFTAFARRGLCNMLPVTMLFLQDWKTCSVTETRQEPTETYHLLRDLFANLLFLLSAGIAQEYSPSATRTMPYGCHCFASRIRTVLYGMFPRVRTLVVQGVSLAHWMFFQLKDAHPLKNMMSHRQAKCISLNLNVKTLFCTVFGNTNLLLYAALFLLFMFAYLTQNHWICKGMWLFLAA